MAALVLVTVLVLVSSTVVPVTAFDGYRDRAAWTTSRPTANLGRKPAVNCDGKRAECTWYTWENFHYPPEETSNCSELLWSALSQGADAATLQGFTYYAPANQPEFYDPDFQEYFCLIGCFNLAASNGSSSLAPPPEKISPPPKNASPPENAPSPVNAPPPVSRSPPPPSPARVRGGAAFSRDALSATAAFVASDAARWRSVASLWRVTASARACAHSAQWRSLLLPQP